MSTKRVLYAFRRGRTRHTCVAYGVAFNPNLGLKRDSANTTKQLRRKRQKKRIGRRRPRAAVWAEALGRDAPRGAPRPAVMPRRLHIVHSKTRIQKTGGGAAVWTGT